MVKINGSQVNAQINIAGTIYAKIGSFKPQNVGPIEIEITGMRFKSVLWCDCRSDYFSTYPEVKPSIDYYGGTHAKVYIPKSFPVGNNVFYIIVGVVF